MGGEGGKRKKTHLKEASGVTALAKRKHDGAARVVKVLHVIPLAMDAHGLCVGLLHCNVCHLGE